MLSAGTVHAKKKNIGITNKSNACDFFTEVDVANERQIIDVIRTAFPQHAIIGEETSSSQTERSISKPTWIIDPIDGTTNFVAGNPLTCISIAFAENDEVVLGVIYAPALNEMYIGVSSEEGGGAWLNGVPIKELNPAPSHGLLDSNICVEFGYERNGPGIDAMTKVVNQIMKRGCKSIRMLGSGVLDLVFVALGRLDAVYCGVAGEGWREWDYAAASVILKMAGGKIANFKDDAKADGSFNIFGQTMVCACNEKILTELKQILLSS
ncbi:hypothetical protein TrVE_jg5015 [Triparma verrucosa]|uniref:Inositol-1-monophosphatase n=1 Tax=Triparma verrucosa TaxID=1606542 RepID=A0A9W7BM53_9STRA|nr:hypothetical protein TrVE_jg5015 [Triparma verrucosa]